MTEAKIKTFWLARDGHAHYSHQIFEKKPTAQFVTPPGQSKGIQSFLEGGQGILLSDTQVLWLFGRSLDVGEIVAIELCIAELGGNR